MGNYASKDDVTNLANDIKRNYQAVGQYQPEGEYANLSDLQNYQPKGDYANSSDLQNYQSKGNYALTDQVTNSTMWCNTSGVCSIPNGKVGQMGNLYFTPNWSGYPDKATGNSEISNDVTNFKSLMLVGNRSSGGPNRQVKIFDDLSVNANLSTTNLTISGQGQMGNLYFTPTWSGYPDKAPGNSEISNDVTNLKSLALIGNRSSGSKNRQVRIYDDLFVASNLSVNGRDVIKELDAIKAKIGL